MEFRTEIESIKGRRPIDHDMRIVMLGSCFSTEIGERMEHDGFAVSCNPMGVLYNPASIATAVERATGGIHYRREELVEHEGVWHCLDFHTVYQGPDADRLLKRVNRDLDILGERLREADVLVITLGTSWVFELIDRRWGERRVVGNCHKLPGTMFGRRRMEVDDIADRWARVTDSLGKRVIVTVSPIRHTADGLHGNQLSKSTLLLAIERMGDRVEYFPAYEIILDDLRDYRFYARDMKHPSEVAVDYVYGVFADTYFSRETARLAQENRKAYKRSQHREHLDPTTSVEQG